MEIIFGQLITHNKMKLVKSFGYADFVTMVTGFPRVRKKSVKQKVFKT